MTTAQKKQLSALRHKGYGYIKIALEMGVSENTVKSYCRRHGLSQDGLNNIGVCRSCGQAIVNKEKRKPRQFCSDACRIAWWKAHPEEIKQKAVYSFVCDACGKAFTAYGNSRRKYCCHACYLNARFGGKRDGNG